MPVPARPSDSLTIDRMIRQARRLLTVLNGGRPLELCNENSAGGTVADRIPSGLGRRVPGIERSRRRHRRPARRAVAMATSGRCAAAGREDHKLDRRQRPTGPVVDLGSGRRGRDARSGPPQPVAGRRRCDLPARESAGLSGGGGQLRQRGGAAELDVVVRGRPGAVQQLPPHAGGHRGAARLRRVTPGPDPRADAGDGAREVRGLPGRG